ncbi:hypothetical protein Hamer_G011905 [Homarus americanus]|uniref:Uncharacterized protein n=1 Tax=Homarus americanus TaxID=6706 RepID=A0A8J5MWL9_HOMAM|nr:hypothetical protein Hamer_G011905 [Homarus americanus]
MVPGVIKEGVGTVFIRVGVERRGSSLVAPVEEDLKRPHHHATVPAYRNTKQRYHKISDSVLSRTTRLHTLQDAKQRVVAVAAAVVVLCVVTTQASQDTLLQEVLKDSQELHQPIKDLIEQLTEEGKDWFRKTGQEQQETERTSNKQDEEGTRNKQEGGTRNKLDQESTRKQEGVNSKQQRNNESIENREKQNKENQVTEQQQKQQKQQQQGNNNKRTGREVQDAAGGTEEAGRLFLTGLDGTEQVTINLQGLLASLVYTVLGVLLFKVLAAIITGQNLSYWWNNWASRLLPTQDYSSGYYTDQSTYTAYRALDDVAKKYREE